MLSKDQRLFSVLIARSSTSFDRAVKLQCRFSVDPSEIRLLDDFRHTDRNERPFLNQTIRKANSKIISKTINFPVEKNQFMKEKLNLNQLI